MPQLAIFSTFSYFKKSLVWVLLLYSISIMHSLPFFLSIIMCCVSNSISLWANSNLCMGWYLFTCLAVCVCAWIRCISALIYNMLKLTISCFLIGLQEWADSTAYCCEERLSQWRPVSPGELWGRRELSDLFQLLSSAHCLGDRRHCYCGLPGLHGGKPWADDWWRGSGTGLVQFRPGEVHHKRNKRMMTLITFLCIQVTTFLTKASTLKWLYWQENSSYTLTWILPNNRSHSIKCTPSPFFSQNGTGYFLCVLLLHLLSSHDYFCLLWSL